MKEYRVTWIIEVTAATAEDAAREALDIMQDRSSVATCFSVVDTDTGEEVFVDLAQTNGPTGLVGDPQ